MRKLYKGLPILVMSSLLVSCGGGSGDGESQHSDAQETTMAKIVAYADSNINPAPTIQDYQDAGVTGVTTSNIDQVNEEVDNLSGQDVDTVLELQDVVTNIEVENPDTTSPSKPILTTELPTSTTRNSISIEVNGEFGATVWVNGVQKGTISSSGKLTLTLDTSGADGTKNFSIVLKDTDNNVSEALSIAIEKTTVPTPDTTKPNITLKGDASVTLIQGDSFTDAGATATDDRDGSITAKIIKTGVVDTATLGTYTIKYNVSDKAGNNAIEVIRTVTVTEVNHAPKALSVHIKGIAKTGETLTLDYLFKDENGDTEGKSIIAWSTPTKELQRGLSNTFKIPAGYEGDIIGAWVHPVDEHSLEGKTYAASNNNLKVLTQYEEAVTLPNYDANNTEMMLIKSDADWVNINNPNIKYFFVAPGDYSTAGSKGIVTLTASGTKDKKRYIILHNGNNKHAGQLERNQLAKVRFVLQSANHWVIDRMAYWDSKTAVNPILVKESSNNVFNRLYFHDVGNGLYIFPNSHGNVVQNSRIERNDISIFHDRAAVGLYNNHQSDALIKNTRIVNNEMRNFVDGFQTIRQNTYKTPDNNFEGTIVDNNHFYIDKTIYTDCQGNHDEDGGCAYAENALDLKVGSANENNPIIISNNKMWGFRKSDETNSFLSDSGSLMPVHYGVSNVIIKNNVGFDSAQGFPIAAKRYGFSIKNSVIEGNIFQNIKGMAIFIKDAQQLTIKNNVFKNIGAEHPNRWMAAFSSTDLSFKGNLVVSTHDKSALLYKDNEKFIALNNQYYNTIYDEIADTVNGTDVVLETDPTANYKDLVFMTDRYTNNPKTITVPKIIKP